MLLGSKHQVWSAYVVAYRFEGSFIRAKRKTGRLVGRHLSPDPGTSPPNRVFLMVEGLGASRGLVESLPGASAKSGLTELSQNCKNEKSPSESPLFNLGSDRHFSSKSPRRHRRQAGTTRPFRRGHLHDAFVRGRG